MNNLTPKQVLKNSQPSSLTDSLWDNHDYRHQGDCFSGSLVTVFAFEGQQVRFVGTSEKPEWVAADVCGILGLDTSLAVNGRPDRPNSGLDSDEKGTAIVSTPGGNQEMLTVTEPGLYRLLSSKSRKPIAKRFQRWVFHQVLPSIRKTGSYSLEDAPTERMRLELELIRAKQHYQDTGHAIALSTSPAMLQWLRGETPAPPKLEYRDRFVDPATGQEVGSSSGRSLTQLIADAGLNPKSGRDRQLIKKILKSNGFDDDRKQRWVSASYLHEYPVLEEELYQQALKVVLTELGEGNSQPNLFVHSLQQASLKEGNTRRSLQGEEP